MCGLIMMCMKNMTAETVIIGGGAAGLMCAAVSARLGLDVVLLEKNADCGRKLKITGKGRCNITNACEINEFLTMIPGDGRFMQSALHKLSPSETISYFESLGVKTKVERGRRVFPVSDRADEVVEALLREVRESGVRVVKGRAEGIVTAEGAVTGVRSGTGLISCENVVLCTGGLSYPGTGSTGDGYKMARDLGHRIEECRGSLVPLECEDDICGKLQGFSLRNVELSVYEDGKRIYKELGEMLFTHFGVSGPLVLSASAHMRHLGERTYELSIDLKPGLDEKKLDARILRDFEKYRNKTFQNALGDLAGRTMIPVLVEQSGIDGETRVNSVTKEERRNLVNLFKGFKLQVKRARPVAEAIVTAGGVRTSEVNPRSMESKLVQGLYFAGEILDLDAYTGGYNLQIAWSSAYAAAEAIAKKRW